MKGLNKFSKEINDFVKSIGFDNNDVPLRIALIHSEISEAFEAFRKNKFCNYTPDLEYVHENEFKKDFEFKIKDTFEDEIADSIIRLLDLCGKMDINIEGHIKGKMKYNALRGYKFGGKKF